MYFVLNNIEVRVQLIIEFSIHQILKRYQFRTSKQVCYSQAKKDTPTIKQVHTHSELDSTFSSIFSKVTKLSNLQNFFFRAFLMLPRLVFRRKKKKFVIKTAVFQGLKLGLNTYFCFFFNTLLYRQDKLFNITLISRYLQKIFLDVLIRDTIRVLLSIKVEWDLLGLLVFLTKCKIDF